MKFLFPPSTALTSLLTRLTSSLCPRERFRRITDNGSVQTYLRWTCTIGTLSWMLVSCPVLRRKVWATRKLTVISHVCPTRRLRWASMGIHGFSTGSRSPSILTRRFSSQREADWAICPKMRSRSPWRAIRLSSSMLSVWTKRRTRCTITSSCPATRTNSWRTRIMTARRTQFQTKSRRKRIAISC